MGYFAHHAIIVTDETFGHPTTVEIAREKAIKIFGEGQVTPIASGVVNGNQSFMVGPDGSKEGWADSDEGDRRRAMFIEYLRTTYLDWAEVRFGGDDPDLARVAAHNGDDYAAHE